MAVLIICHGNNLSFFYISEIWYYSQPQPLVSQIAADDFSLVILKHNFQVQETASSPSWALPFASLYLGIWNYPNFSIHVHLLGVPILQPFPWPPNARGDRASLPPEASGIDWPRGAAFSPSFELVSIFYGSSCLLACLLASCKYNWCLPALVVGKREPCRFWNK